MVKPTMELLLSVATVGESWKHTLPHPPKIIAQLKNGSRQISIERLWKWKTTWVMK